MPSIKCLSTRGNWFTPSIGTPFEYTYDDFITIVKRQLENYVKKLSNNYTIVDISNILEEHTFEKMAETSIKYKSKNLPFLSFHSTQNITKVNSILKYGYIIPGENHPTQGWTLRMSTGNMYGDGIYSSPDFTTSDWYGLLDFNSNVYVIVNFLIPGKVTSECTYRTNDHRYKEYGGECFDTIRSNNMKIWVSGDASRLVPVAMLTLKSLKNVYMNQFYHMTRHGKLIKYESYCYKVLLNKKFIINSYRFCGEISIIDPKIISVEGIEDIDDHSSVDYIDNSSTFRHIICSPCLQNREYIDKVNNFVDNLEGDKLLFTYDKIVKQHIITKVGQFKSYFERHILDDKPEERICEALKSVFNVVTKDTDNNKYMNIIYLFVNKPKQLDRLEKIKNDICKYSCVKKIIIKLIFINEIYPSICQLKAKLQTVFPYEQYFNQTTIYNLPTVFQQLIDEMELIPLKGNITYSVPFPLGIIGEGFLTDLGSNPDWDKKMEWFYFIQRNS